LNAFIENENKFMALLNCSTDYLSLAVKAHYSIDKLLNFIILQRIPNADAIEFERIAFLLKVDLATGLGLLREDLRPIFNLINSIRNRFAHNPYFVFSDKDIQDAKNVILSRNPTVTPASFKKECEPQTILETLFAVGFINATVAYDSVCRSNAATRVSNQMAAEAVSRGRERKESGLSVHDEFHTRLQEYLETHHPEIDKDLAAPNF
jgi:hypothetical protein